MTLTTVLLIIGGYFLLVKFICKFFEVATKHDELENNEIYLPENDNHETRN